MSLKYEPYMLSCAKAAGPKHEVIKTTGILQYNPTVEQIMDMPAFSRKKVLACRAREKRERERAARRAAPQTPQGDLDGHSLTVGLVLQKVPEVLPVELEKPRGGGTPNPHDRACLVLGQKLLLC